MTVSAYIKSPQSLEIYAFSWDELVETTGIPIPTLRKELA